MRNRTRHNLGIWLRSGSLELKKFVIHMLEHDLLYCVTSHKPNLACCFQSWLAPIFARVAHIFRGPGAFSLEITVEIAFEYASAQQKNAI